MQYSQFFSVDGLDQFGIFFLPDSQNWPSEWILVCPAFAEEQNKSRALVAQQARRWNQQGYGVLHVDLHGTGDSPYSLSGSASESGFVAIDWNRWVKQILDTARWLMQNGALSLSFFGLRLGALLAMSAIDRLQLESVDGHQNEDILPKLRTCLMWQPVLSGKTYMTQFLRLRTASSVIAGGNQESVGDLRALAKQEGEVEVAGYRLPWTLIDSVDQLKADTLALASSVMMHWVDIGRNPDKPLAPVASKLIDQWSLKGIDTVLHRVNADGFWSSQELVEAPDLLQASQEVFQETAIGLAPVADQFILNAASTKTGAVATKIPIGSKSLEAIAHHPQQPNGHGIVLVVGGPQYRVGSHRQFYELAESLVARGFLVVRFDCQGMGDSEGEFPGFEHLDENIAAAVNHLYKLQPSLQTTSLWGLCDAATAISFYASQDERIDKIILLNPWVRSDVGLAQARMTHYYSKRLLQGDFWKKLFSGRFNPGKALTGFSDNLRKVLLNRKALIVTSDTNSALKHRPRRDLEAPLIVQMQSALLAFQGKVLLVLSGRDLTAQEFEQQASAHPEFKEWLQRETVSIERFAQADHTFSRHQWKRALEDLSADWLME